MTGVMKGLNSQRGGVPQGGIRSSQDPCKEEKKALEGEVMSGPGLG